MQPNIANLLGSRICHDLISPIGAISNGVELIGIAPSTDGAELSLINESAADARARIRFFRVAYGKAAEDQTLGQAETSRIVQAYLSGSRVSCSWTGAPEKRRRDLRVAFLIIQCFENAMPTGGLITINDSADSFQLSATAENLRYSADLWETVTNSFATHDFSPAEVQFALLPDALQRAGRSFSMQHTDTAITVTLN